MPKFFSSLDSFLLLNSEPCQVFVSLSKCASNNNLPLSTSVITNHHHYYQHLLHVTTFCCFNYRFICLPYSFIEISNLSVTCSGDKHCSALCRERHQSTRRDVNQQGRPLLPSSSAAHNQIVFSLNSTLPPFIARRLSIFGAHF